MKPTSIAVVLLFLAGVYAHPSIGAQPANDDFAAAENGGRTLEDFFTAALNTNPNLSAARARWSIGTARKDAMNGQFLPQVNASANLSDNQRTSLGEDSEYKGKRYSLQVSQVLFNWEAYAARQQAYLLEDQTEAEYYLELAKLLTDVADKYLSVLQAEDALLSVNAELDAMTNQINQIETMYGLQLVKITDLYAAQARLAAVGAEHVDVESNLAVSREALRAIADLPVGNLARLPVAIEVPQLDGDLNEWLSRANANNRQIAASSFALQRADKAVSQERGAYLPRASLVFQQQLSDIGFENVRLSESETSYVGIDFSVPLFAGGSNRAAVREATSRRSIAESELKQIQLDTTAKTRIAYLQVKSGESRINAARTLAESTTTSYTAMQRGFELATVTSVDVLNALRDQFRAQRDLQKARYDHIRANLVLRREAGILTAADLLNVSGLLNNTASALNAQ